MLSPDLHVQPRRPATLLRVPPRVVPLVLPLVLAVSGCGRVSTPALGDAAADGPEGGREGGAAPGSGTDGREPDGDGGGARGEGPPAPDGARGGLDVGLEAADAEPAEAAGPPMPRCDPEKPFGRPQVVAELDTEVEENGMRLMPDERTAYFFRQGVGILRTSRSSPAGVFGVPVPLSQNFGPSHSHPTVTSDGLTLFLNNSPGGSEGDILVAQRPNTSVEFKDPAPVRGLSRTGTLEGAPYVSADGNTLYFHSTVQENGAVVFRIFHARRRGDVFDPPERISLTPPDPNSASPVVTPDELTLYYFSEGDVWVARRPSLIAGFANQRRLTELSEPGPIGDFPTWIAPDECAIYLHRFEGAADGFARIYRAVRPR